MFLKLTQSSLYLRRSTLTNLSYDDCRNLNLGSFSWFFWVYFNFLRYRIEMGAERFLHFLFLIFLGWCRRATINFCQDLGIDRQSSKSLFRPLWGTWTPISRVVVFLEVFKETRRSLRCRRCPAHHQIRCQGWLAVTCLYHWDWAITNGSNNHLNK